MDASSKEGRMGLVAHPLQTDGTRIDGGGGGGGGEEGEGRARRSSSYKLVATPFVEAFLGPLPAQPLHDHHEENAFPRPDGTSTTAMMLRQQQRTGLMAAFDDDGHGADAHHTHRHQHYIHDPATGRDNRLARASADGATVRGVPPSSSRGAGLPTSTSLIFKQPTFIAQSVVNRACGVVNTKGFLLMVTLFLLRYRTFSNISKKLALLGSLSIAFIANFNLDMDSKMRKKGLTVGISRLFTLGLCFLILKRYRWTRAPFYCGLVARVVPVSMYYFFRGLYEIIFSLLCRFENQQLLPSPSSAADSVPDASMQCCICLDVNCDYRTSCNHYFHRTCLEQWAEIKLNCPLCTQRIQSNHLWTRELHNYFVLNYNEWRQMHHFLCGDWWTESVISRRGGT